MGNSGGHIIPFSVPISKGFELLSIAWGILESFTFNLGGIEINMKQFLFASLIMALLGYLLRQIFDW